MKGESSKLPKEYLSADMFINEIPNFSEIHLITYYTSTIFERTYGNSRPRVISVIYLNLVAVISVEVTEMTAT